MLLSPSLFYSPACIGDRHLDILDLGIIVNHERCVLLVVVDLALVVFTVYFGHGHLLEFGVFHFLYRVKLWLLMLLFQ